MAIQASSEGNCSRQPILPRLPLGSPLALDWIPKRLATASKGMGQPREKPNKGKSASETLKLKVKTSAKEQPQRSFGGLSWLQGRSRVRQASNRNETGSGLVWGILTLMLVVGNLANTKLCKSPEKDA